jgi:hypothetical protein
MDALPKKLRGSPAPFRIYAPIFLGDLGLSLRAFSNGATKLYSLSNPVQMLARLVILGGSPFAASVSLPFVSLSATLAFGQ